MYAKHPATAALLLILILGSASGLGAQTAPGPVSAVDSLGRRVELKSPARRIISLSPEATETLYACGAAASMVADTSYCDYPAQALALPKIGGYAPDSISIEKILSLKPDLVVSGGKLHAQIEAALVRLGIHVFAYEPKDFKAIADGMMALGELAGARDEGVRAAALLTSTIGKIRALTENLPPARRPTVFWQVYDEPLMTCGRDSFAHQLIEAAGGRDVFADLPGPWPVVSSEEVLRRAPQYILSPDDMGEKIDAAKLAARPGWAKLPAVRDQRLFLLPADLVSRAGPRMASGLLLVLKALHPELTP